MAGFCGRHGQPDGFQIAHFTYQNGVGVLAQRRTQCIGETVRHHYFPLVDQTFFRFVHEFDRVLHRKDVPVLRFVQEIDHGSQCGGLARSRGPGHQHETARPQGQIRKEILGALSCSSVSTLLGMVRKTAAAPRFWLKALTRKRAGRGGKVASDFLIVLALGIAHDVVHHGMHFLVLHYGQIDALDITMHPQHGRQPRRKVQVGRLVFDAECQKLSNIHAFPC